MKTFIGFVMMLALVFNASAADALTEKLQRGLFEEEANHDLDAAIKEYQSVVSQADEQRKVMATALFRLGECYRKLGRTNEANAQYERVLRDFSEQEQLVKLSRSLLPAQAVEGRRVAGGISADHASIKLLREEIALAEQQVRGVEARMNQGKGTLDELLRVKQDVLRLKRMLPENAPPAQQKVLLEEQVSIVQKLLNETQRRVEVGVLAPGEDVPLKRELLALQRELSVVSDVATSFTETASANSMTQAESEALARAKTLARNSPDLLQNPTRDGLGELQLGARDGFYSVVEFILAQGVSANGPERGTPPIVLAARTGHLRIVQLLLDKGADVNAMGGGNTALMAACENGYRAVVELLLQRGADVNRVGSSTALHKVAAKGYAGIAELLLQHGAKPDVLIGKETPLHFAVGSSFADVAGSLLNAGASATVTNGMGVAPLHIVASRGDTNMATRLLDKGANPNAEDLEGKTPLYNALHGPPRPIEMVRLLIARGSDVNRRHIIKPPSGQTMSHYPLIDAIAESQQEIVDAMLEAKADLNVVNQDLTPLMVSVRTERADIVERLLRAGANPNQGTAFEPLPLFTAVGWGTKASAMVEALLKHGADPNFVNRDSQTPMFFGLSQPEILQLLLDYKADPNKGNPLPELLRRRAASASPFGGFVGAAGFPAVPGTPPKPSDYPAIEVLLKGGANPNATFSDGARLLTWAVSNQDGKLVDLLLKHGAEVNFVGNNETPLSLAQRNVQNATVSRSGAQAIEQAEQIEKALRKHGANEYLQRLSSISYTRPAWTGGDGRTIFPRGTNDYNRHTLFEMLAVIFTANDQPVFPDLSRVTIERLEGANPKRREVALNVDELIRTGDCSNNLWLEWGDRLSLPETDHPLNEVWQGLPQETLDLIAKCLARRVSIIVKQETNVVKLTQNWNRQLGGINYGLPPASIPGAFPGARPSQPIRTSTQPSAEAPAKEKPEKVLHTFRLKEVVYFANVLRASSDPTRVRVTRREGDKVKEWVFDLNRLATATEWNSQAQGRHLPPWEDLWLRDGDVIEIPEKQ
jgi:ankyrin repeat protein